MDDLLKKIYKISISPIDNLSLEKYTLGRDAFILSLLDISDHNSNLLTNISKPEIYIKEDKMHLGNNPISQLDIFVKDDKFRMVLVNDSFCKLLGFPKNKIMGKTMAEDLPAKQMEGFLKIDKQVLSDGEENLNEEVITNSKGDVLTILTKKSRYIDEQNNKFIIGTIRDITEQKQNEEDIKRDCLEVEEVCVATKSLQPRSPQQGHVKNGVHCCTNK